MPIVLPYNRVVNVTLTKQDNFPTRAGFGVPLIISDIVSDVTTDVAAATPVKTYSTMQEVAADWGIATGAYAMAQDIFQQSITAVQIKIGYCDPTAITAGLDLIEAYDPDWYWGVPTAVAAAWHDVVADMTEFMDWFEVSDTRRKTLHILSSDANTETATAGHVAELAQTNAYSRTAVYYHPDITNSLNAATANYGATRTFDDANSAYTAKFKSYNGMTDIERASGIVQRITGFVPSVGLDETQGWFANTYINVGGRDFLAEGSMADGGFIDEKHFEDWLVARTQEEVLALFLNNARIEYSDKGNDQVVQAVTRVLARAMDAGLIIPYEDTNGDIRNWQITTSRVASLSAAQRRQRIGPAIAAEFRYAGAIHYTTVNYTMTF